MDYKIDLHTHSIISQDGGITREQYMQTIKKSVLDCIAITDHNETKFAAQLHQELGQKIIIGEETTTTDGEIIGLFLKKPIPPGLTAQKTAKEIHNQGGLVYIPHPFETFRQGLKEDALQTIKGDIDIIEVFNARGMGRGKPKEALEFAKKYKKAMAASSDAHMRQGMGSSFSIISEMPTEKSLGTLLTGGTLHKQYAPLYTYFGPKINKINKWLFNKKYV